LKFIANRPTSLLYANCPTCNPSRVLFLCLSVNLSTWQVIWILMWYKLGKKNIEGKEGYWYSLEKCLEICFSLIVSEKVKPAQMLCFPFVSAWEVIFYRQTTCSLYLNQILPLWNLCHNASKLPVLSIHSMYCVWQIQVDLYLSPVLGNGVAKDEQPVDDGTKGELCLGPGAGGMNPRQSEIKRALPLLHYTQEELLKKAKRYAMEQSVQQVIVMFFVSEDSYLLVFDDLLILKNPWNTL